MEETSDATLVQLIAESTAGADAAAPTAEQAEAELRRRHLSAALVYAGSCGRDGDAARELADDAWELAVRQVRQGSGPAESWRHPLLLRVAQTAADWAADGTPGGRWTKLAPTYVAWSDESRDQSGDQSGDESGSESESPDEGGGEGEDWPGGGGGGGGEGEDWPGEIGGGEQNTAMALAYRALPEHTRNVLWHAVVERERDARAAALLGIEPGTVGAAGLRALYRFRGAYLEVHAQRGGESCRGFTRMIEVAARGSGGRRSADLDGHLAGCRVCTGALTDLTALDKHPGVALGEALLPWDGAGYVAARLSGAADTAESAKAAADAQPRTPLRRWVLVVAAVLIAVGGVLLASRDVGGLTETETETGTPVSASPPYSGTSRVPRRTPPRATVTATVTATATVTVRPRDTARPAVPSGDTYTQLVNADTGLCMDIDAPELLEGADVGTQRCSAVATQTWFLDDTGLLHNGADPSLCLDSRGDTGNGVGVASCLDPAGGVVRNLRFRVTPDGSVRPLIAPGFAVTSGGDTPGLDVGFKAAEGRADQRWQRGAAVVRPAA